MVTFPVLLDINAETKLCGFCEPASHKSVTSQSANQAASKQAAIIIRSSGDSSDGGGDSKAVAANEAHRQTNRHKQSQAQHSTAQYSTRTDKHARTTAAVPLNDEISRTHVSAYIVVRRQARQRRPATATATATARDYNLCAALVQRDLAVAVTEPEIHPVDSVAEEACQ
jgi:hypothetical protein